MSPLSLCVTRNAVIIVGEKIRTASAGDDNVDGLPPVVNFVSASLPLYQFL
jgi:hypothetical protein